MVTQWQNQSLTSWPLWYLTPRKLARCHNVVQRGGLQKDLETPGCPVTFFETPIHPVPFCPLGIDWSHPALVPRATGILVLWHMAPQFQVRASKRGTILRTKMVSMSDARRVGPALGCWGPKSIFQ